MSVAWKSRHEAGAGWLVVFIRWVALHVSKRVAELMLLPITVYFLVVRGAERRASRDYLRRVLGRKPGLFEVGKHILTFARTILDRVALLAPPAPHRPAPVIRVHDLEHIQGHLQARRGVLLFGSHLGSFDVVRAVGLAHPELKVRILMDYGRNPQVTTLLEALNARARESVIDVNANSTNVLLEMHETLAAGGLMGILVDRPHTHDGTVPVMLLGAEARLPTAPFRLASVLGAPVVLIFGLLKPDGSYDVYFEAFAERIVVRRGTRDEDVRAWAQQYAVRLEARMREAPYNWFNFYDYWV